MQLHGDAPFGQGFGKLGHDVGLVGVDLLGVQLRSLHLFLEDRVDFLDALEGMRRADQGMVAGAAAHLDEEVQPLDQGLHHVLGILDFHMGRLGERGDIAGKGRFLDLHGLVRTVGGNHLGRAFALLADDCMVLQVVRRVIGRADGVDLELFHDAVDIQ